MTETVGIIGGDKRYLFCAGAFEKSGYDVTLFGFDRLLSFGNLRISDDLSQLAHCGFIIFPVPPVR